MRSRPAGERPLRGFRLIIATIALALCGAGVADAQPKGKPPQPPAGAKGKPPTDPTGPAPNLKSIQDKVRSGDAAKAAEGLNEAKAGGKAATGAAPAIEELIKKGSTTAVVLLAIEALGAIGAGTSSAAIRPYLKHRTSDVRRAAVRALGLTKGPEAIAGFKESLRSEDGMVRGFSATGLGTLGAADALPDLFLALNRNVTEAAASIGQLCGPDECEKFASRLGSIGFDVMTSGFDPILFREKPLAEASLIKIVGRLRELGTPESAKYLADVQARWPANGSKKVRQAIDTAVTSIPGGGK